MSDETQGTTETAATAETASTAATETPAAEGQAETPAAADAAAGSSAPDAEAGAAAPQEEESSAPAEKDDEDSDIADAGARALRIPPTPQERVDECKRYIEERCLETGSSKETHLAFLTELELAGKALLEHVLKEAGVAEKDVSHYYKEGKASFEQFVHKISLHIQKPQ